MGSLSDETLSQLGTPAQSETNNNNDDSLSLTTQEVMEALKDVIDPELGINIVDLGLVYGVEIDGKDVVIDMTLTSAACPLTDQLEDQCRMVLMDICEIVSIRWVWIPPWGPDKITDDGRAQLRAYGYNV